MCRYPSRNWFYGSTLVATVSLAAACSLLAPTAAERPGVKITATYPLDAAKVGEVDGVDILDGGYSALEIAPDGGMWVVTDRGPNLEATARAGQAAKRFPIPGYHPTAERIEITGQGIRVVEQRNFLVDNNRAATGLPTPALTANSDIEIAYDAGYAQLSSDADGIDSEGITFDGSGGMWVSDEYRPSLWHLDAATGRLIERYTPTPSAAVDKPLPTWLLDRSPNLGFEGVTFARGYIFAALQSPIQPPGSDRTTRITRLVRLDPATGEVESYAYALEGSTRKIGDLAALPDGRLLVLEHGLIPGKGWSAEVYAVQIGRLTKITEGGLPPERFRDPESAITGGVALAPKTLYVDLLKAGWDPKFEKPEGLTVDANGRLLLVNDNDYGLESPGTDGAAVATESATVLVVVE